MNKSSVICGKKALKLYDRDPDVKAQNSRAHHDVLLKKSAGRTNKKKAYPEENCKFRHRKEIDISSK
eukprot:CAMPEP_0196812990 /NCGR_PEP_ID=MMETSP1362-20130617/32855_1 /TAXON_ID=163516 /ORGANISM="Leptocylindrus danicus, Strain CCMP1856" /LENGTH=66 /DNA_ID=CAMNT_0042188975 /DNA_START=141 /DNA_END=341 /DNA_ORIENTATION=-